MLNGTAVRVAGKDFNVTEYNSFTPVYKTYIQPIVTYSPRT